MTLSVVDRNPFTLVRDALWQLPQRHPVFRRLVKEGNKIKFEEPGQQIKPETSTNDMPEVALFSTTAMINMQNTSSSTMCRRSYSWVLNTGDFRLDSVLYQVEWALFVGMTGWQAVLAALTWKGVNFVKVVRMTSVSDGQSDSQRNRGIKGWSAVWTVEVEMHFQTADLTADLTGDC